MTLPRHQCNQLGLPETFRPTSGPENCAGARADFAPSAANAAGGGEDGHAARCTVLLVERDAEIRGLVRYGLEREGFHVMEACTGREAESPALRGRVGAILLDMDAAGADGPAFIRRLRERSAVPILALAGRIHRTGAVSALDHGANDYIARPFNIGELSARIRAAQRFTPPEAETFQSGSLSVNFTNRTLKVGERTVKLSATEYSLLQLFARHAGKALGHAQILREVWGAEMTDKVNYLRVYMRALRKKLENPAEPELFVTERFGYRMVVRAIE